MIIPIVFKTYEDWELIRIYHGINKDFCYYFPPKDRIPVCVCRTSQITATLQSLFAYREEIRKVSEVFLPFKAN